MTTLLLPRQQKTASQEFGNTYGRRSSILGFAEAIRSPHPASDPSISSPAPKVPQPLVYIPWTPCEQTSNASPSIYPTATTRPASASPTSTAPSSKRSGPNCPRQTLSGPISKSSS
ncbi:hypothetical protein HO173_010626 [Letharia columbiana]|uniref:Uncharacterized protein n=1 Tax=Letharia columbiana TaxID=112416 RepID=A0A8H6FM85_9LECA|nr:uncharacterized protein HO173_010626 [Letharia columbiana]KAF6231126.1 hypothetical protein HO173_010626 [Letharia columbiana]